MLSEFYRAKFDDVVREIKQNVLPNNNICDYEMCRECCNHARMRDDCDEPYCIECYREYYNVLSLYYQSIFGKA